MLRNYSSAEIQREFDAMFGDLIRQTRAQTDPRVVEAIDNVRFKGSMVGYAIDCQIAAQEARDGIAFDGDLKLIG